MFLSLPIRPVGYLVAFAAALGLGIDTGSVVLTRMAAPDQVRESGHAAARAVERMPVTGRAASIALKAAADDGERRGLTVRPRMFRLHRDGRVQVTMTKTAPTLLLKRVEPLRHYTRVTSTAIVSPLPFS
jgi:hypothetical protein